ERAGGRTVGGGRESGRADRVPKGGNVATRDRRVGVTVVVRPSRSRKDDPHTSLHRRNTLAPALRRCAGHGDDGRGDDGRDQGGLASDRVGMATAARISIAAAWTSRATASQRRTETFGGAAPRSTVRRRADAFWQCSMSLARYQDGPRGLRGTAPTTSAAMARRSAGGRAPSLVTSTTLIPESTRYPRARTASGSAASSAPAS